MNCRSIVRTGEWVSGLSIVRAVTIGALVALASQVTLARGVSPYLPLATSTARERDIERALILAGKPVLRRPVPAAVLLDALPAACQADAGLCARVRGYLDSYETKIGLTRLQAEGAIGAGDSGRAIPNSHGRSTQDNWAVSAAAHYQPSPYVLFAVGGIASESEAIPTGTMVSMGVDFAQLDVGYRDHWLSPSAVSGWVVSTEAPTMPSVTLSNYRPISPLGLSYEIFAAKMSRQDRIAYFDSTTSGNPNLAGIQLAIEPVRGYGLSLNRAMQFGGGARGGANLSRLRQAFFNSNSVGINLSDGSPGFQEFGNQIASVAATMQFPGQVPFAVNMEYAGEDNAYRGDYRLGDTALSLGVDFPTLWRRFDLRYEVSEWQNVWYTHHIYPQGMTNRGYALGHWFADQRRSGDQVGGRSNVLQLGMRSDNGAYWQATYRTLLFLRSQGYQQQPAVPYKHLHELSLKYSTSWKTREVSGDVSVGQDALGDTFGRVGVSIDLAPGSGSAMFPADHAPNEATDGLVEYVVDVGANYSQVLRYLIPYGLEGWTGVRSDYHLGVGVRRAVSNRGSLGVRLELDRVSSRNLLSLRAVDYQFRWLRRFSTSAFLGVGRYDDGAPAFGWYGGVGVKVNDVRPKWDIAFDWRRYDKISRNRVLPNDYPPTSDLPRIHYDVKGYSLYLSRRF